LELEDEQLEYFEDTLQANPEMITLLTGKEENGTILGTRRGWGHGSKRKMRIQVPLIGSGRFINYGLVAEYILHELGAMSGGGHSKNDGFMENPKEGFNRILDRAVTRHRAPDKVKARADAKKKPTATSDSSIQEAEGIVLAYLRKIANRLETARRKRLDEMMAKKGKKGQGSQ